MAKTMTIDVLSMCIGGVGAQKCAVPLCTNASNSIPISERFCKLHKCSVGQLHCDCTPPLAFFVFPSKLEDRVRWIKSIKRSDLLMNGQFDSMNAHHICCRHFPDGKPTDANPDPVINLVNGSLEQKSDSEKDDKLKISETLSEKITPTDKTPLPKEPAITEKRRRKPRRSKELSVEPSSSESESSESDSDSSSDTDGRVYCKCGEPNTDNMIGCDGKKCEHEWFHFKCVGIANRKKVPRGKWYCEDCSGKLKGKCPTRQACGIAGIHFHRDKGDSCLYAHWPLPWCPLKYSNTHLDFKACILRPVILKGLYFISCTLFHAHY